MENLILSIVNKDFSDLDQFFISLADSGYRGHTCIFAGPNSDLTLMAKLAADGVEIIRFETTFPYVSDPYPDNFKSLPDPTILYNYRYFLYYDYLLKNPSRFANVLLSDIQDVVFQRDPFEIITEAALYIALENNTVGRFEYTSSWMQACYEQTALDEAKPMPLLCSGTMLGPTAHILRYLKTMVAEMLKVRDSYNCFCQAIHNVLLYTGQLEPTVRLTNPDGRIITVGIYQDADQLRYDKQGHMLGKCSERSYIVHQFDRHLAITLQLDKFIFKSFLLAALTKRHFGLSTFRFLAGKYYRKSPVVMRVWRSPKQASGRR